MDLLTGLIDYGGTGLTYVLPFLFVLTIIVFFHELGHFMVARWAGISVEVFSVGFGREIFGFTDRKGTRWKFSWIPLGGYVKFLGDENAASMPDREALEEMRLSVRGLTGRPMVLSDSLADWRSEVVSRLGQAGIECEWRNPSDTIEEPLSSRTYVQTTRIVREAVSNIIKHSSASHVVITADVDLARGGLGFGGSVVCKRTSAANVV